MVGNGVRRPVQETTERVGALPRQDRLLVQKLALLVGALPDGVGGVGHAGEGHVVRAHCPRAELEGVIGQSVYVLCLQHHSVIAEAKWNAGAAVLDQRFAHVVGQLDVEAGGERRRAPRR